MEHIKFMEQAKDPVFNSALICHRRKRAQKCSGERFLHTRCIDDALWRIGLVNRTFERVVIIANQDICTKITQEITQGLQDKVGETLCVNLPQYGPDAELICGAHGNALPNQSFDLVLSLLNLHKLNDPQFCLRQINGLLKSDGFFIGCLFGGSTLARLRRALYEAEAELYQEARPRIAPMIRLEHGTALLAGAKFTLPVVDRDVVRVRYAKLHTLYNDLRLMGETNVLAKRSTKPVSRRFFARVDDIYRRDYADEADRLPVDFEILWLSGWRADKNQPKPLKPGSAQTKLADALGVKDVKL